MQLQNINNKDEAVHSMPFNKEQVSNAHEDVKHIPSVQSSNSGRRNQ